MSNWRSHWIGALDLDWESRSREEVYRTVGAAEDHMKHILEPLGYNIQVRFVLANAVTFVFRTGAKFDHTPGGYKTICVQFAVSVRELFGMRTDLKMWVRHTCERVVLDMVRAVIDEREAE